MRKTAFQDDKPWGTLWEMLASYSTSVLGDRGKNKIIDLSIHLYISLVLKVLTEAVRFIDRPGKIIY